VSSPPPHMQRSTDYRGLSNLGVTDDVNCLVQTLFMNPEFRRSMYRWKGSDKVCNKEDASIALQLQRLFVRLQRGHESSSHYVSTKVSLNLPPLVVTHADSVCRPLSGALVGTAGSPFRTNPTSGFHCWKQSKRIWQAPRKVSPGSSRQS
jgi:hypothetical protein